MAGIGFRLQKYFSNTDILQNLRGTLYSIIISSGPWLISVLTIAVISFMAQKHIHIKDLFILKAIICYTFAFSLVIFGLFEMPLTRYLADQLYVNDTSTFRSLFLIIATFMLFLSSSVGYLFYSSIPELTPLIKIFAIGFFYAVLMIWLSMVFLTAAKNYHQIVFGFITGGLISIFSCFLVGKNYGLQGYVLGYCAGQVFTAIYLMSRIFKEFNTLDFISFEFLKYFKTHRILILSGLFYYLGIWIDKVIFWFGADGEKVITGFYTNRYYDTAMFLAYITVVPSLAIFMIQVETNFYKYYTYYFRSLENRNSLQVLDENIRDIIESIKKTFLNLIKIQLIITFTIWYFAEEILDFLYLPSMVSAIFKYGVIGAFLQILFLIINLILLYFLNEKTVFRNYLIFFVLNGTLSYLSTLYDVRFYGFGYLISCFVVFILSLYSLGKFFTKINFYTFMSQPIER